MTNPTDEMLMALADGALPALEAQRIQELVDQQPELAARVAMFRQTRLAVADALKPKGLEPVPRELEDRIRSMIAAHGATADDNVVRFAPRAPKIRFPSQWAFQAAASIAVAIVAAAGGYFLGHGNGTSGNTFVAAVGSPVATQLASVLSASPTGSEIDIDGVTVRLVNTVRTQDGTVCREFEADTRSAGQATIGVACRSDKTWRLDIAVAAAPAESGYAPASSLAVVENYLNAIGAGEPLSSEEEKAALQ